tara:strand:+ start:323 stop:625 length:303 start_codon:yes stop_codon:yes gene_type:complete
MSKLKGWDEDCLSDLNIPSKWKDASWHNDACPSFYYNGFQIWVAEKDPKLRELGKDSDRFMVGHASYYGEMRYPSPSFEDFNEVLNYVSNNFGAFIYIYK